MSPFAARLTACPGVRRGHCPAGWCRSRGSDRRGHECGAPRLQHCRRSRGHGRSRQTAGRTRHSRGPHAALGRPSVRHLSGRRPGPCHSRWFLLMFGWPDWPMRIVSRRDFFLCFRSAPLLVTKESVTSKTRIHNAEKVSKGLQLGARRRRSSLEDTADPRSGGRSGPPPAFAQAPVTRIRRELAVPASPRSPQSSARGREARSDR
jgi:hypothetical protein